MSEKHKYGWESKRKAGPQVQQTTQPQPVREGASSERNVQERQIPNMAEKEVPGGPVNSRQGAFKNWGEKKKKTEERPCLQEEIAVVLVLTGHLRAWAPETLTAGSIQKSTKSSSPIGTIWRWGGSCAHEAAFLVLNNFMARGCYSSHCDPALKILLPRQGECYTTR